MRTSHVTDLKKQAEDATKKAMVEASTDAAKRAALGLFSSDDDPSSEPNDEAGASKSKRNKLILLAALGLFVVIGVLGMLMSYWHWFLALGVTGLGGLYLRRRVKRRLAERREEQATRVEVSRPEEQARKAKDAKRREADVQISNARARAEAEAEAAHAIEDELEALKARLDK